MCVNTLISLHQDATLSRQTPNLPVLWWGNRLQHSKPNLSLASSRSEPYMVVRLEMAAVFPTCASPKFYSHYEWRDSLPRRVARPGYSFTLQRQESLPEEPPRGIPAYIKDGGMRTFSRR